MRTILIGQEEVMMDPAILEFGETNLNEFLQKIGSHSSYFTEKHADAMFILSLYEDKYEETYSRAFAKAKSSGNKPSDGLAEALAKSQPEVAEAKAKFLSARLNKDLITGWLKSLDKTFQAAMNYGYNRRKEMDKLNHDIMETPSTSHNSLPENADERMANLFKE